MITPDPSEYAPFAANYVALVNGHDPTSLLETQQQLSFTLFSKLSEEQAGYAYAPGKWTIRQVLGHLIEAERTFAYRAMAFSRQFTELPGFDQDKYVQEQNQAGSIQDLAQEFSYLRKSNIYMIKAFSTEQLAREGIASRSRFTVRTGLHDGRP